MGVVKIDYDIDHDVDIDKFQSKQALSSPRGALSAWENEEYPPDL
jgi:hypothetical protein